MRRTRQTQQKAHHNLGPILVIRGALVMSFLLMVVLLSVAGEDVRAESTSQDQDEIATSSQPPEYGSDCQVSSAFPDQIRRWCVLIVHYAEQNDLPPDLIAALIWQESGGDPEAYSHSGAVGLMQVMPRDGIAAQFICQNGPCFASRPTISELKDPEYNISYGTGMLSGLKHRYGDIRQALRAYGPMDVGFSYADKVISLYQRYGSE